MLTRSEMYMTRLSEMGVAMIKLGLLEVGGC